MRIAVHGKNIDTGASLQEFTRKSILGACTKYFDDAISADVVISKEANLISTAVTLHLKRNTILRAEGQAADPYDSVKESTEAIDKQLRRLKRKLTDERKRRGKDAVESLVVA